MEFLQQVKHSLFTPEGLQQLIVTGGYLVLFAIVFAETGLLVGFFLPGDSLLFMAGVAAGAGHLDLFLLWLLLSLAAIIGDSVGYWVGARAGQAIYSRPDSLLFKRKHLLHTKEFYEKHGGMTIVLARFLPLVRTFAPVVAGVAQMHYRRFLFFNVFGGIGWIVSLTLLGFTLGQFAWVQHNLEKMIVGIIVLSFLPVVHQYWKMHRAHRFAPQAVPAATPAPTADPFPASAPAIAPAPLDRPRAPGA